MPSAKNAVAQNNGAGLDPASLGALIPDESDEESVELSSPREEAPPLLRHEPIAPPPSQSPGQLQRGKRVAAAAASAPTPVQPRKDVARMLPSQHRVYVYKKKPDGKMIFCNEYSAQELQGTGTIEVFIKKHVVPDYKYGEFHVYYYDGQSKEPQPMGTVTIEAPASEEAALASVHQLRPTESKTESLKELFDLQQQIAKQQQQPKSAIEVAMEKTMADRFTSMMSGGKKDSDGDGSMLMMMMLMDRMKPQAPAVDSGLQRLFEKTLERLERLEEEVRMSAAMVPPPSSNLPPPPSGPSSVELMLEAMKENTRMMVEAMRQPQRDPIKDLSDMAVLMAPKNNEALTTKDIFTLLPQFRDMLAPPGATKDPFEKTIENFRLFKMMQREFGEGDRPAGPPEDSASGFWQFAKGLVQSDIGKSIAQQILQQGAGQQINQHGQQRAANAQQQAQVVAQRRAQDAARQRQLADGRAAQLAANAQQAQQVAVQAQAEAQKAQAAAAQPQAQPPAPPPQQSAAAEGGDEEIYVPEGFLNVHLPAINTASSDAERIGAIITGFQLLATSPDFRPPITKMFGLCKLNRRLEALEHLKEILEFFSENEVLDPSIPQKAVEDFDRHWKIIRSRLEFPDVSEVWPEGHPNAQAQQPAPEAASPAEAAPAAVAS